jgi:polysaccharide chain length determinant protein (PEP-CTERM system associated)
VSPFINEVWDQFRGSWRFRWPALAAAAALAPAGWLVVFGLEDRYEAGASVFVDPRTPLKQEIDAELNFVRQSLLADPSLQRITKASGVLVTSSSDLQRQALLADLRARIEITVRSANGHEEDRNTAGSIYHIAYRDHDRARSLGVVTALLETLINETLADEREGSEKTQRFLESEIADADKRLKMTEDRLAAFKSNHPADVPQGGGYFAELQKESEAVAGVESKLAGAESRRQALIRELHTLGIQSIDQSIAEAQAHLEELLRKYTEAHPDVIAARQALEDLKRRRAEQLQGLHGDDAAAPPDSTATNLVSQSLRLDLHKMNGDIADLNAELARHKAKVTELRRYLDTEPKVEAEYTQLNRDYEVNKAEYAALLAEREKLRQGRRAVGAGAVSFKVVQPPTSYGPVWPRRKPCLAAVLVAAIVVGAALAYGLNYLFPVVGSGSSIARMISVPVLGEVTAAFPERERRAFRRDLLRISMATTCLLVAFTVAVILSQSGYRLSISALKHLA